MSRRVAWPCIALCVIVGVVALGRLNPFFLLEPDGPDYVVTARALATFDGYRTLHRVGSPPQTFRPPGLPLLLVPAAWVAPFDPIVAKLSVLALTILMLGLLHCFAERVAGSRTVPWVLGLVAVSPYTLLHATEVLSEVPYVAGVLGVLCVVLRRRASATRLELGAVSVVLTLLPFVRSIGIAMVGALGLWALVARERRRWWFAIGPSLAATALWSWRNHLIGGTTYVDSIRASFARQGPWGFIVEAFGSFIDYLGHAAGMLLPGLTPGQPLYQRFLVGDAPDLAGLWGLATPLGWIVLGLCALGIVSRWKAGDSLVALYVGLYLVVLAIYPPEHERLVWPLVPLLWVYVPVGLGRLAESGWFAFQSRPMYRRGVLGLGVLLLAWQLHLTLRIVVTNLEWRTQGEGFYAHRVPPSYYSDWLAAGRWIREHTAPDARLLSRHSDVALTAHRFVESIRFEEVSPQVWRQRAMTLGARYLVYSSARFDKWFHTQSFGGDPAYRLSVVYRERDVTVVALEPNRTGTVEAPAWPAGQLAACAEAAQRLPGRVELTTRWAELLAQDRRAPEGVAVIEDALAAGREDPRLYLALGELRLELDRPAEALEAFREAQSVDRASRYPRTIERGLRQARERAEGRSRSPVQQAADLTERARRLMDAFLFEEAGRLLERARRLDPRSKATMLAHGEWLQRHGRNAEAAEILEQAVTAGAPAAVDRLLLLRGLAALEGTGAESFTVGRQPYALARDDPRSYLWLVERLVADGTPGLALEWLERAVRRFPGDPRFARPLAQVWRVYGEPELAGLPLDEPRF